MTDSQFRALAKLAGITDTSLSWKACHDMMVKGLSQAHASRNHDLRPQTVHASMTRIQLVQSTLPGRLALIRTAMGD